MEYQGYKLNIWDVGGQKTLRSYWRNYFEATDGLVWVVSFVDASCLIQIQSHWFFAHMPLNTGREAKTYLLFRTKHTSVRVS
jgi:hypothetical protein